MLTPEEQLMDQMIQETKASAMAYLYGEKSETGLSLFNTVMADTYGEKWLQAMNQCSKGLL